MIRRVFSVKSILLVLAVFLISLYALPFIEIRGIKPDFWVLIVLFYAFRADWRTVPFFAFLIGLIKDILSPRYFGVEIFTLGMAALILSYTLGKLERQDPWVVVLSATAFSLIYETGICLGYLFVNGAYELTGILLWRALMISVYTLFCFPWVFFVLDHVADLRRRDWLGGTA
ncbi:MAG: rod shape-determining protein MreD [Candidatus Omnitrophica bacterium]|nr:rod shape-determining protein MreD [Candidatus Omnitrophota bacterium]